ncbi:RyR domain-containing protein [Porcipelethomonas ammoniilytica]|uniref:RyR domain-containing protein n=1 Tax=Porcipelethomonas ammoniilytica TaxID=2981722 RepID=UPI0008232D6E|nr:RyR domain-containing protein [Porcipelethomonas ammoniilytica]MCU6720592.1 RyR domain-containing protein [Porcipelethomonas ammoniilytica]SCJ18259.1 RyR domain [uncultured Ruminococcus sp.]
MYLPKPIDTSAVSLSEDLLSLTEKIAANVHDVWAVGRIAEGWTYGEEKNVELKTTPCLVPYDELPESEKDFDRNTAMETLRLIVKMGYKITKEGKEG